MLQHVSNDNSTSSAHSNDGKKGINEFAVRMSPIDDDEAVPDALTVDELIAGKLDIEYGIEEAVKANCNSNLAF